MGEGLEDGPPRAAMVMAMGARGELCSSGEVEGHGLEHVQEDMGVLTVEGIGPRWPERGDRRECSAFGEETEEKKIGARRKSSGAGGGSEGLRWWQRADWGAFYRRDEAVEEGREAVAGRCRPASIAGRH